jgi:hypothetical protein
MVSELLALAAHFRTALIFSAAALLFIWSALLWLSLSLVLLTRDELRPMVVALIALAHLCVGLVMCLIAQRSFQHMRRPFGQGDIRPGARTSDAPRQV